MREARARRGIELSDVERATKIRVKYLRAMEEERWELLPGAAYARGFLRTYGSFLGLDGKALVEEYGHRHEPVEDRYPEDQPLLLRAPGPGRPRLTFSRAVLAGLTIAALAGVVAVLGLTGGDGGERAGGEGRGAGTQKDEASATVTSTAEPPPRPSEVSREELARPQRTQDITGTARHRTHPTAAYPVRVSDTASLRSSRSSASYI